MADPIDRKLAAILSADVVGYSRLMADDEAATIRTLGDYREQIAMRVRQHRGRVVDAPGDNVLAEFPTALDAVRAAVEIQAVLRALNASLPDSRRMDFRIGVHMGDVATDGDRLYGDGVNIAARLESLAEAGGICISATVHEQVRNKIDVGYADLGDQTVKNIPDQVHVYRVQPKDRPEVKAHPAASPRRAWGLLPKLALGVAAFLLVAGAALWATWPRPLGLLIDLAGIGETPDAPALPEGPSIAVLPFQNLSGDPEQEYFSDGITEELTADLAHYPNLFVAARNSAFTYKGEAVNVERVGRELGVRYVLEGSVRRAADRVRITVQLIDATTGGHIWSERYDRELADIFALQSEISDEVVGRVGGEILRAEERRLERKAPASLSAYDAYLKGMALFLRSSRENNAAARELFLRSIELDASFAPSHAALGVTYWGEYANGWSRDPGLLDRAEEGALRAIALDPAHFQGHVAKGWVAFLRDDLDGAVAGAERAIELAPNFPVPHALLGLALARKGRIVEALGAVRKSLRMSPRAPIPGVLISVAYVNAAAGRRRQAVEFMERTRDAVPDNLPARVALAGFYGLEGRRDRARAEVAHMLRVRPDLTAESAIELVPGLDAAVSAEELAQLPGVLRAAGLP